MKPVVLFVLKIYKIVISPILETMFGKACRYRPTCSEYAFDVINKKGVIEGGRLSLNRLIRCNPLKSIDFKAT